MYKAHIYDMKFVHLIYKRNLPGNRIKKGREEKKQNRMNNIEKYGGR